MHTPQSWIRTKDAWVLGLVLLLLPIVSQAGGLGVAAIASLGGGLSLIGRGPTKLIGMAKRAPLAFWALMGLLLYGLISSLWSPYQSSRSLPNPVILLLGLPLYFLFARLFVTGSNATWPRRIWLWGTVGSAIAILVDLTTGYSISLAIDPVSPGEELESRRGDLIQNLGHGVAVLTLLFPAVAVTFWKQSIIGKFIAIALAAVIIGCGISAGMSASVLAIFAAILMMGFAYMKPLLAVLAAHILAALALLLAPLIGWLTMQISADQLSALPFSWEERIHNWRYVFGKITEHPMVGHGFDAVRTFDDKHTIRGFDDRAIVSLHPHNAGLHIWVELGFVGICLALIALFFSYSSLKRSLTFNKAGMVAIAGTAGAALVNASLTFGVWQDWWWAAIILSFSTVAFIFYATENI